jgi:glycosyltransferase involved in cell wall biosynthesis
VPDATLVVTTKDRRSDLRRLLESAGRQSADLEILVIDDGSSDGTSQMLAADFPDVRVERCEVSRGYIAQRNRGAVLARAPVIVSVDDDAELPSPHTVAQTLADFDHPRIGAVAIPCVDVRRGPEVLQRAPDDQRRWITNTYWGTAHAVRRDVFLAVGGYREELRHQVEETDYCLRALGAGYVTRLGRADHLRHHEAASRNPGRIAYFDRRNHIIHAWRNVPLPYLPVRLAKIVAHTAVLARTVGQPAAMARGLAAGAGYVIGHPVPRRPVSRAAYRVDHRLRKAGPLTFEEIDGFLPPPGRE